MTPINNDRQLLVPPLRFSKFDGEWLCKKLSEIFSEVTTTVGERNIDTYSITAGTGFVSQSEKFGRNISGRQNSRYIVLEPNQFSYNKGNSKTYKYGCIYLNQLGKQIAVPNVFISFELEDETMVPEYFAQLFESHYLDRGLRRIISSSARSDGLLNVSKINFFQLSVCFPKPKEQQKIADFLTAVDDWIENLKQQKAKLEEYKRGVMQKIFSQEIRFKNENGEEFPEWEDTNLGKLADFMKGKNLSKSGIVRNGINECIRYGQLYTDYTEVIHNVVSKTNIEANDSMLSKENDLLIPSSGEDPIDIAKVSCIIKPDIIIGSDINIVRLRKGNSGIFFAYYINTCKCLELAKKVQGYSIVHLYNSQLKSLSIAVPCLAEQLKIANYFETIDKIIMFKQREVERAIKWKQGLFQKLFV